MDHSTKVCKVTECDKNQHEVIIRNEILSLLTSKQFPSEFNGESLEPITVGRIKKILKETIDHIELCGDFQSLGALMGETNDVVYYYYIAYIINESGKDRIHRMLFSHTEEFSSDELSAKVDGLLSVMWAYFCVTDLGCVIHTQAGTKFIREKMESGYNFKFIDSVGSRSDVCIRYCSGKREVNKMGINEVHPVNTLNNVESEIINEIITLLLTKELPTSQYGTVNKPITVKQLKDILKSTIETVEILENSRLASSLFGKIDLEVASDTKSNDVNLYYYYVDFISPNSMGIVPTRLGFSHTIRFSKDLMVQKIHDIMTRATITFNIRNLNLWAKHITGEMISLHGFALMTPVECKYKFTRGVTLSLNDTHYELIGMER